MRAGSTSSARSSRWSRPRSSRVAGTRAMTSRWPRRSARPWSTRSGSVPIPPIPTAPASDADRWRSTGTSCARSLNEQLHALGRAAGAAGAAIEAVKAHGALYEEVAKGGAIYETFRDAVREACGERTALVLRSGCRAMAMVLRDGVVASEEEGFCDRAYRPDGGLVDRAVEGAVLHDSEEAAAQALSLAKGAVVAVDGSVLTLWVDTLCIHGDSSGAVAMATAVRQAMADAGIDVVAPAPA